MYILSFFQPYKLMKMYKAFSKYLKTRTKNFKMEKKNKWILPNGSNKKRSINFHVSYYNQNGTHTIATQKSKNLELYILSKYKYKY